MLQYIHRTRKFYRDKLLTHWFYTDYKYQNDSCRRRFFTLTQIFCVIFILLIM